MLKAVRLKEWLPGKGGRLILAAAFFLFIGSVVRLPADAYTGYDPLDDPAIMVKSPDQTMLVTIVRVGQRLFAAGEHGVIIYSDDNGVNWRQAKVPVDLLLTDILFTSSTEGWAVGHYGAILHSVDGGLTWRMALNGLDVIKALQDASARSQIDAPGTAKAALELRVATAYNSVGPSKPFLALGSCAGGALAVGQQDMAMLTTDDGKTWLQWTSNIPNPNFNNIYSVLTEGNLTFLIGEGGMILKSDAGCANFEPVPGPYTGTLFGGRLIGQNSLIVYGLEGGLFITRDNGKTWNALSVPSDVLIDSSVELPSGQILLGTFEGFFYLSDADITAFHRLSTSAPFQISDIALAPNGDVVVVGNGGVTILKKQSIQ